MEFRFYKMNIKTCFLIISLVIFLFERGVAQDFYPSQRPVEKTRIQYQKFVWKYFSSQNFEVYYFGRNEALAKNAIQMLESDFIKITDLLSYTPFQKTKIFVYPSQADLMQSNSGISLANLYDAKNENLSKFRIEIAFSEHIGTFRKNLIKEVAQVFVHDMLFGGSIKDVLQNSLLLNLPEWYISGISAYISDGDSPEMNQYMYQVVTSNKVRKPSLAKGKEAELLGHSIWNYIGKTYGKQPIGNILNLTRIIRNDQSSISSTLKKPFAKFLKEWFEFYLSEARQYNVNTTPMDGIQKLISREIMDGEILKDFKISADGNWMAYILDDLGKYRIYLMDVRTKKSNEIFQVGLKDPLRFSESIGPKLFWGTSNTLSILYHAEGKSWLQIYTPISAKKSSIRIDSKKNLGDYLFLDFELAPNNQRMLVRTLRNGQVDVGIYDLRRNRYTPVTQDPNNESEAHWLGKNGDVIYVSDRYVDSLSTNITKDGLNSLYRWKADEPGKPERIFSHKGDFSNIRLVSDSLLYFLVRQYGGNELVSFNLNRNEFLYIPIRAGTWQSFEWIQNLLVFKNRDNLNVQIQKLPMESLLALTASQWLPLLSDSTQYQSLISSILIDSTDNQHISARDKKNAELKRIRLERQQIIRMRRDPGKLLGPIDYQNSFIVNNSEGNFKVDPVRGLGYSFEVKMNDLLENHQLRTGIFLTSNLKNTDLWFEYGYLANKIDWFARIDRKVLDQENESSSQKIRFNRIEIKGVYPLDLSSKLSFSGIFTTNRAFDQYSLATPEDLATYGGTKMEYSFDNTVHWEENLRTGFRLYASVENQIGLMNSLGFTRLKLDARKYMKLSNTFLLAARVSYTHASGDAARQTVLGGMDNWLFVHRDTRSKENPLGTRGIAQRDVFMSDFATSLRGFNLNKLSGNSSLLVNLEVRIPLKSLMGPDFSKSRFINSFQFIGFTDIGSAWTGANPFSKSNGFNTNVYGGNTNPFQATVTDFRNPFLVGYGLGVRANLLGYFIKLDYAFGIENSEVRAPITYLTFGHDF